MLFISLRKTIPLFALVCGGAAVAQAQQAKIKPEPLPYTSPTKGIEMYAVYCAPCHGVAGKGNGPAASALKTPPPDLTILKAKNNGKFPEAAVYTAIRGDANAPIPAHGERRKRFADPLGKTDHRRRAGPGGRRAVRHVIRVEL